jgi:HAD superfamily hydrolase (TIGR01490 family)
MNIALFDFDGTITSNDNFTGYFRRACSRKRKALILWLLLPVVVLYILKILSSTKTRAIISFLAYKGRNEIDLLNLGLQYSSSEIPNNLRQEAIDRISWHKTNNDIIVVVSASLNVYLQHWCNDNGLELICTKLETKNGEITGRYESGDCTGPEKARRVAEKYDLKKYKTIYVYGDTAEDKEMLDLGNVRFYRWKQMD